LGSLLVNQGRTAEAINIYQQAVVQNAKNTSAYYNLGVTLYNQGAWNESARALKRAREQYIKEGNIEQVTKTEQIMQQITQILAPKQLPVNQPNNGTPIITPPVEQLPANLPPVEDLPINTSVRDKTTLFDTK
jgi:tetratricopeptide (TPR) repeat protein